MNNLLIIKSIETPTNTKKVNISFPFNPKESYILFYSMNKFKLYKSDIIQIDINNIHFGILNHNSTEEILHDVKNYDNKSISEYLRTFNDEINGCGIALSLSFFISGDYIPENTTFLNLQIKYNKISYIFNEVEKNINLQKNVIMGNLLSNNFVNDLYHKSIMRFYKISSRITIDGIDIYHNKNVSFRKNYFIVNTDNVMIKKYKVTPICVWYQCNELCNEYNEYNDDNLSQLILELNTLKFGMGTIFNSICNISMEKQHDSIVNFIKLLMHEINVLTN